MIICGIDPGPTRSAVVRWCTLTQTIFSHILADNTSAWLSNIGIAGEQVVIEDMVGYGQRVGQEVFDTCKWIGRFWERCCWHHGTPVFLSRQQVLKSLGIPPHRKGDSSTDTLVRGQLIVRFGPLLSQAIGHKASPGPLYGLKGDEWSALALALVYADTGISYQGAWHPWETKEEG